MSERDERILNACLEELLAGTTPPDLTARITESDEWSDSSILDGVLEEMLGEQTPPGLVPQIVQRLELSKSQMPATINSQKVRTSAPPIQTEGIRVGQWRSRQARRASPWLTMALTLTVMAVGSAFGWLVWMSADSSRPVAAPEVGSDHPNAAGTGTSRQLPGGQYGIGPFESIAEEVPETAVPSRQDRDLEASPPPPNPLSERRVASADQPHAAEFTVADDRPEPLTDEQIVRAIDGLIRQRWEEAGVAASAPVDDAKWCDRVFNKLIGRHPTENERTRFVDDQRDDKRHRLVAELMNGETYVEEFAAHWSDAWIDVLLDEPVRKVNRDALAQYLRQAFASGKPFDAVSYELITATGSSERDAEDYRAAASYLLAYAGRDGVHAAAATHVGRTFVGMSMECNRCHDDLAWRGFQQQTFWNFNAFFRQLRLDGHRLVNADVAIDRNNPSPGGEIYYELPNGLVRTAYPRFFDGTVIPPGGAVSDVDRRDLLAQLVTRSDLFRQVTVNRYWSQLFGIGFTDPVDDFGQHNPPSHPELLAKLGDQFAAHNYDVRSLLRWIVLSQPFRLSAEAHSEMPVAGNVAFFARFPQSKVSSSKSLTESLVLAGEAIAAHQDRFGQIGTLGNVAPVIPGTPPGKIAEEKAADVDRMLKSVPRDIQAYCDSTLFGPIILDSKLSAEQKIDHMFYATKHRAPTRRERAAVDKMLAGADERTVPNILRYVWWALRTSR